MAKIIKLTEAQLNKIVKRVLVEGEKEKLLTEQDPYPDQGGNTTYKSGLGGTNTSSAGAYVTPGGINFDGGTPGGANDRTYTEQPSLRYGDYPDPYDDDNPRKYPKRGSFETKLKRSPMCCKKCKNGRFKHQCDDTQKGGKLKYDSTNCVYATISDCQLNKRSKPGNISKRKKKSKK
jgi:hypothetical protein